MSKISCVMTIYNEPIWMVERAIKSLLNQTIKLNEIIVVVDNPEYIDVIYLLEGYQKRYDNKFLIIKNNKNIGLAASLNKAIKQVSGEYVCRMDADDESLTNRLEIELNYLVKNNLDLVGSLVSTVDENGRVICERVPLPCLKKQINLISNYSGCLCHPTWLFKLEVWNKIGGYRESMPAAQDGDFVLRAIKAGFSVCNVNEVLLNYTIRSTSITGSNTTKQSFFATYSRDCVLKNKIFDDSINFEINSGNCILYESFKKYYEMYLYNKNLAMLPIGYIKSYYFRKYVHNIVMNRVLYIIFGIS